MCRYLMYDEIFSFYIFFVKTMGLGPTILSNVAVLISSSFCQYVSLDAGSMFAVTYDY